MKIPTQDVTASTSWHHLADLAVRPFALNNPDALVRGDRLESMVCGSAGLKLLFATQRVDHEVVKALADYADEHQLVEQFRAMRRGAVLNRIEGWESENRQVLHTSCRDLFSVRPADPASAEQARREFDKLRFFLEEVDAGVVQGAHGQPFETILNVGIGGSDLGPRATYEALRSFAVKGRSARFIANVDPDDASAQLSGLNLARTLVTVVSKSGSTLETLTNETLVREAFYRAGLDPARHFIAVTGAGSPMDNPEHYLRSFYMFDYIGGRYSTTSMVGCVLLGFCLGVEQLSEFLRGAHAMDEAAEASAIGDNMPLMLAMLGLWNRNFLGYPTLAILPYSQALHRFAAHLQQCDMESNGKSITRTGAPVSMPTGPVIWGEPGTNGQHAFYQLMHQGSEVVPVEFIGFLNPQRGQDMVVRGTNSQQKLIANLLAQAVAFAVGRNHANPNKRFVGNRPSSIIIGERLNPRLMGALLALYEAKIVLQGFGWNINSFDQEGVELGKALAGQFMRQMSEDGTESLTLEARLLSLLTN
jgi:glucose-6-phosphate isomerase